jgi:glycosyltransferase involved in cell wall biosynthesis
MIVKNEETKIAGCLENIKDVVDEIVIVDGCSTDKTAWLCRKYTDKFYEHKFSGSLSVERNISLSKARNEWVLVMDADEALSPRLKSNIRDLVQHDETDGYYIPRLKIWDGKPLRHGRAYPDYQLRLFKKSKGAFVKAAHETFDLNGRARKLEPGYDMFHYDSIGFRKNLRRVARLHAKQTTINAQAREIISVLWGFFMKKGFLDGYNGFKYHFFKTVYALGVIYFIIVK